MLEVPVYNTEGKKIDTWKVDEAVFGGEVNVHLLKQAVVTYHANQRQGTVATKNRSRVEGSTRKLYRQKGTGNARRGAIRTNVMRGGGNAFGKLPRDFRKTFPRQMRKAALNSAILSKILGSDLMVLDGLKMDAPKTKEMAGILEKLDVRRTCLLTLSDRDSNVYLSSRNIPDLTVRVAGELNAFDVVTRQKMLVTAEAMKSLMAQDKEVGK
ncbi:MAG TPA: 50S ribosomal protein L4 [Phycisphaerae bacterium]|nr:50S ribosomal protein L4 [Phycisphaerae bacterium]